MAETEMQAGTEVARAAGTPAEKPKYNKRRPNDMEKGAKGGRRPAPRRKACQFCVDKIEDIDYKDVARIRRFMTEKGKILPRRQTGTCAKHQRMLTTAIKRSRYMALLHYKGD